ncbi:alpha/beta hydrolase [Streptomyces europaeiscabiei]|uniref:Alpha/beta hydrolase n=1 Tax=Streptomyces europaeiscabiei TaxID=146819 RepID=A0ABU4NV79_9ACTN|nr:alpha/beta hydrolase [Streptomyces europaeiscabiei]MDX3548936.1 alpha/beta hydrolase [Streptomyces europaeiscabiei]MDX3555459.1 alpha/beta hydrolase [Streptomyces europaeiscabiei]MDX3706092.1 alpha/beta hydrolase [Streptomyces europaeiscabiei]
MTARTPRSSSPRTLVALAAAVALSLTSASASTAAAPQAAAPAAERLTGTLPDGAAWIADVPENWNGTLVVFSHGFGATVPQNAPREAVRLRLLEEGYALTGSSYDVSETLWALESAERDQVATIAAVTERIGEPTRTLSVGQSMGGLVNARLARSGAGGIDGALGLCGLVAGANDLHTYQLDAEYTIARLLLPGTPVKLVDFASEAEGAATGRQLTDAVVAAQKTPEGRARIALAAAYLNLPAWSPGKDRPGAGDWAEQQAQQYEWLAQGILTRVEPARYHVEKALGGNNSGNKGVDYARVLSTSQHAPLVKALYKKAGLDLRADLRNLTANATVTADPAAVAAGERTSSAGQGLAVPLLDVHTVADDLVPVEQESRFATRVRASGDAPLLRQAYVERQGHCTFTTAETVAALHALESRLDSGRWGVSATPGALQTAALALGLDGAAYVPYRPAELTIGRRP